MIPGSSHSQVIGRLRLADSRSHAQHGYDDYISAQKQLSRFQNLFQKTVSKKHINHALKQFRGKGGDNVPGLWITDRAKGPGFA